MMARCKFFCAIACMVLSLATTTTFAQENSLDGVWLGGIEMNGEWMLTVVELKTDQEVVQGAVTLPFQNIEGAPTQVQRKDSQVQFKIDDKLGVLEFDGQLNGSAIKGKVGNGETSGIFELYHQLDPKILNAYMGFYETPDKHYLFVQPWDEMGGQLMYVDEPGVTRALFPSAKDTFIAGPTLARTTPVETTFTFVRNKKGLVTALRRQIHQGRTELLPKVELYDSEEVNFHNGEVTLAGTLFVPKTKGPHPALVLTHGSGPMNRTGGLLFVNSLLAHGVSVLTYDKRGVEKSTGSWMESGFDDLAGDALAGVEFLKSRKDINPKQIGIWGLSQGGWIGPLAASRSGDVAFVIALSAPAVTPAEQELTRTEYEMRAQGCPEEDIQESLSVYKLMNNYVRTGQGWDDYLAARQKAATKKCWPSTSEPPSKDEPYYTFWRLILDYDPAPNLQKVNCPILVIYAGFDENVKPDMNKPVMENALKQSANKDYEILVYPEANHVMLEVASGNPNEITNVKRFVPGYLDKVRNWVLQHVTVPK